MAKTISINMPIERGGANPEDVRTIQDALNRIKEIWGGSAERPLAINGKWDEPTQAALRRFQTHNLGVNQTTDGRIEPRGATIAELNQILNGGVDIVCIDWDPAGLDDGDLLAARQVWESEHHITSVADLVNQVLHLLGQDAGKKVQSLTIVGHGRPGAMCVGCGKRADKDDGSKSFKLKDLKGNPPELAGKAKTELMRLRGSFTDPAVVILSSCEVARVGTYPDGTKVDGKKLLMAVSSALGGVWVQASDSDVYSARPGMEGTVIRCDWGSCWYAQPDKYWWGPKNHY
jgi:hypothetical protein